MVPIVGTIIARVSSFAMKPLQTEAFVRAQTMTQQAHVKRLSLYFKIDEGSVYELALYSGSLANRRYPASLRNNSSSTTQSWQ